MCRDRQHLVAAHRSLAAIFRRIPIISTSTAENASCRTDGDATCPPGLTDCIPAAGSLWSGSSASISGRRRRVWRRKDHHQGSLKERPLPPPMAEGASWCVTFIGKWPRTTKIDQAIGCLPPRLRWDVQGLESYRPTSGSRGATAPLQLYLRRDPRLEGEFS